MDGQLELACQQQQRRASQLEGGACENMEARAYPSANLQQVALLQIRALIRAAVVSLEKIQMISERRRAASLTFWPACSLCLAERTLAGEFASRQASQQASKPAAQTTFASSCRESCRRASEREDSHECCKISDIDNETSASSSSLSWLSSLSQSPAGVVALGSLFANLSAAYKAALSNATGKCRSRYRRSCRAKLKYLSSVYGSSERNGARERAKGSELARPVRRARPSASRSRNELRAWRARKLNCVSGKSEHNSFAQTTSTAIADGQIVLPASESAKSAFDWRAPIDADGR